MESQLHQQLKSLYGDAENREVVVDGFRIDAIEDGRLIEVQCASLSAIRTKVADLLERHDVHVVKPLAARKYLVTRDGKRKKIVSKRYSPKRETVFHVFNELVHFVDVLAHPRLTLEVLLIEYEEQRVRRKKRRRFGKDYRVSDRVLRSVDDRLTFRDPRDLYGLFSRDLPTPFTTADIAKQADIPRWLAQKAAYCLRKTGEIETVETRGRLRVYREVKRRKKAA